MIKREMQNGTMQHGASYDLTVHMEKALQKYRENRIMEPLFRMHNLIAQEDELKATTLLAVAVQYISDHYTGKVLAPSDVQRILRAVLLHEEDGHYYARYLLNELQVMMTGWLLILAADLPITVAQLGQFAEDFAAGLALKQCVTLTAADVLELTINLASKLDMVLVSRIQQNRSHYLQELRTVLMQ